jgi:hypothetical protein
MSQSRRWPSAQSGAAAVDRAVHESLEQAAVDEDPMGAEVEQVLGASDRAGSAKKRQWGID